MGEACKLRQAPAPDQIILHFLLSKVLHNIQTILPSLNNEAMHRIERCLNSQHGTLSLDAGTYASKNRTDF